MISINIILPHIKKYGGVRRYLEFGNALLKIEKNIQYNIWLVNYNKNYDWIKELDFKGSIHDLKNISNYNFKKHEKNIVICGDTSSLKYISRFPKQNLKIVNVIFPVNSGYALGDYGQYVQHKDPNLIVVGNSTGWYDNMTKQSNYYTIPGAINLDMFYPEMIDRAHEKFSVLFMAKDRPWKGYDQLLSFVKHCHTTGLDIAFGYFDTQSHPQLDELGVASYVDLPQSEMRKVYSSYDCFLSLEQLAGWQNTVAEAMACQTAVVTTTSGTRDIAKHNQTALVLDSEKDYHEQLLTYLFLLRENISLRLKIAKSGYTHIQQYSWERYAEQYLDLIYDKLNLQRKRSYKQVVNDICNERLQKITSKNEPEEGKELINDDNETEPVHSSKDNDSCVINDDEEKIAIKEKAELIHRFCELYGPRRGLIFDKFDKMGAYHWVRKDIPYSVYLKYLTKAVETLTEFYGDQFHLLDVGCGDGYVSYKLKDYFKKITLIDNNETAVSLAKQKLIDENDIKNIESIKNDDFFKVNLSNYDVILLSQLIEQFEHPEEIVNKIYEHKNDIKIVILSTPLARKDGQLWDAYYHAQEFFTNDLIELFAPLRDDFILSTTVLEPYQQILVLENRNNTLNTYLNNIFFNPDFQPEQDILPDIVQSITSLTSSKPQISYINIEDECKEE